jgi:3-deoxy-manno-octulosonate cytidylyltransferase (CMP-KDO synthetase)
MPSSALGIIPARFAATRFPGKPLVDLHGKPMIQRVWEGAKEARSLDRVVIATDDEQIVNACKRFGVPDADVVMTASSLPSGTDRIAEAYKHIVASEGREYSIVVNIQGDEPLLRGAVVDALVEHLADPRCTDHADVATPMKRITDPDDLRNPMVVKIALAKAVHGVRRALYFSRSPIPSMRDATSDAAMFAGLYDEWLRRGQFWKHVGIYAYKTASLLRFQELEPSVLEFTEQLEQLRLLEDGARFACVETSEEFVAIDTPSDAERVRAILSERAAAAA